MAKWKAKKSNKDKRVKMYSNPGVSEVIYRDEWKKHDDNNGFSIFVYIAAIVIGIIILYMWLIK